MANDTIYTIGHSNHTGEHFISLLQRFRIDLLVDVRSTPYSQWHPQFNKEQFSLFLKANNIGYLFLGRELGARSDDKSCYIDGQVQYALLARTPLFQSGIECVLERSEQFIIALMCAEKEPLECHRSLLVGKALADRGKRLCHIHANGRLETEDEAMSRLLQLMNMPELTLFESRDDLIDLACKKQERIIAYQYNSTQAEPR